MNGSLEKLLATAKSENSIPLLISDHIHWPHSDSGWHAPAPENREVTASKDKRRDQSGSGCTEGIV